LAFPGSNSHCCGAHENRREPVEKSVENLGEWGLKIGGRNGGALTVR
jgi:hypothetical protein